VASSGGGTTSGNMAISPGGPLDHRACDAKIARQRAGIVAADALIRGILEALCQRDGLSLESGVTPGEPARNYDLALRLGIGHVFGLKEEVTGA
jgi:hypothetical protein